MTTDYPDFMAPAQQMLQAYFGVSSQIAALIATGTPGGAPGGVPLLNYANSISLGAPASVGGGGVTLPASGNFPINQIGYHGLIDIKTANVVATTLTIVFSWYIQGSYVGTDSFLIYAPSSGTGTHQVKLKGPTKGNGLVIQLFASSGTVVINNFVLFQDSRVYSIDLWESDHFSGLFPGWPLVAVADPDVRIIASESVMVLAGLTQQFLLPVFTGKAKLTAKTSSGVADMQVVVQSSADALAPSAQSMNTNTNGLGVISAAEIWLPRAQCSVLVNNQNAANQTCQFHIMAADY